MIRYTIYYTLYIFPCRYRQKTGFAGPWEKATLTRRREPALPPLRKNFVFLTENLNEIVSKLRSQRLTRSWESTSLSIKNLIKNLIENQEPHQESHQKSRSWARPHWDSHWYSHWEKNPHWDRAWNKKFPLRSIAMGRRGVGSGEGAVPPPQMLKIF